MKRSARMMVLGLCVLMAAGSLLPTMIRGAAPVRPVSKSQGGRTAEQIIKDLSGVDEKVHAIMPSLTSLGDPAFRTGDGQKLIPIFKQMDKLFGELGTVAEVEEARDSVRMNRYRVLAYLAALEDKDAIATLDKDAQGKGAEATSAKTAQLLGSWLKNLKDAAAQEKLLPDMAAVAKANPKSEEVAASLGFMSNVVIENDDLNKKIVAVIKDNLSPELGRAMLASIEQQKTMADAEKQQKELVGKPLSVAGRTSSGGNFDVKDYKGKVVLIDFWATWCGPCVAELPNVKAAYKDLHDKGFEIVGVSCDSGDSVLNEFTQKNEMPWIQLRESSQSDAENWHPLAKQYGVLGIPTMFLIDKKGVLRYVDAREDLAKKAKQLLAEADGAPK